MTLGQSLRNARITREINLDDAAAATKIRKKYLEALENEQLHVLPDRSYGRCFLRTYAALLELESGNLLERFDEVYNSENGQDTKMAKTVSYYYKITTRERLSVERDAYLISSVRKKMESRKERSSLMKTIKRFCSEMRPL